MMAEIEVINPGLFSTIQDEGRFGFLEFGVPMSGPMDNYASRLGNLILNNSVQNPVLEITQTGPSLKFLAAANIIITGADLSPLINENQIKNNRIYNIRPGEILKFGKRVLGSRAYISIQGGFLCEKVLNSCSWYEGLTSHFRLEKGMKLYFDLEKQTEIQPTSGVRFNDAYLHKTLVPVFEGPEFDKLSGNLQKELGSTVFTLDSASNRMAVQLQEKFANSLSPIITGAVIPGTIQLTPSGKIIILMKDCQTTGGYPRILQVSREGLNIIAQKSTGDQVQFEILGN